MTAPTLTEALALAIHKSRPSNEAPEFDMGVASRRAERIVAALPPDLLAAVELGQAWQACEAALPRRWRFSLAPYYPNGWEAEAHDITRVWRPENRKYATGTSGPYDTPAAALRALEAALRDRP